MFRTMGKRTTVAQNKDVNFLSAQYSHQSRNETAGNQSIFTSSEISTHPIRLRIDVPLLLTVIVLLIVGILMVSSASNDPSLIVYGDPWQITRRQLTWMLLGIGAAVFLTFINYHFWQKIALPAMGITILALIAVLFVGEERQGAVRTLFGGSVQPSELAKLMIVIYLAVWLFSKRDKLNQVGFGLIPLAVILGSLGGLIYVQPDLSAVVTIFIMGVLMFFLAGGNLRYIALMIVVAFLAGLVVIQVSATASDRIGSYRAGLEDPMQASPHVRRSFEAFVSGGWFGQGIGNGETKRTGLPVPHTDSIFAVVGEELGVFGAALLVGLFTLFLWRGIKIASQAPDELGSLLAAGLAMWISIEAFINMAVMLNLAPFAGNALPFISAGGSNLVTSLVAVGILLNISRYAVANEESRQYSQDGRFSGAVVDLRWWDRGRSVSRSHRSPGADPKV